MARTRKHPEPPPEANGVAHSDPPPDNIPPELNGTPPQNDIPNGGNRPAASFKHASAGGIVEVAVWQHQSQGTDGPFISYTVTCTRSYKTDNEWKRTSSLRAGDIPLLLIALQDAFRFVVSMRANETKKDELIPV